MRTSSIVFSRLCRRDLVRAASLLAAAAALSSATASAIELPGEVVIREGQVPAGTGEAVAAVRSPFVNGNDEVAAVGTLANDDRFIFIGNQVVFVDSSVVNVTLSGGEASLGASATGGWIYSPSVDGSDALWSHNGLVALQGEQAPGFVDNTLITALVRPTMTSEGVAHWIAGINDGAGGVDTVGQAFYRSPTVLPGDAEVLLAAGQQVGGFTLSQDQGVSIVYAISDDATHHIHVIATDTGSTLDNEFIYVDGALPVREGDATGDGDVWEDFDFVSINNAGNYLFSGHTSAGLPDDDEFIAYNGAIAVRENATIDDVVLATPATVIFTQLNDDNEAVHAWTLSDGTERAFYACDASDLAATSVLVLTTGDTLDLDADGVPDVTISDIIGTPQTPSKPFSDFGYLFIKVALDDGAALTDAIVRLPVSCCGDGTLDGAETCDDGNEVNEDDCLATCTPASCGDGFVWAGMETCDDGNASNDDACLDNCEPAFCGDGFIWVGMEDCDDANAVNTDACLDDCVAASCGDGFVQEGVEGCDDGNDDNNDLCLDTCVSATCGDGFVQAEVEACDDGNADNTDACLDTCIEPSCGDGFVQDGVEECDDGNRDDDDDCDNSCMLNAGVDTGDTTDTSGDTSDDSTGGDSTTTGDDSMTQGGSTLTASGGDDTSTRGEPGTDSGTDTDGSNQVEDDDGCGCTTRGRGRGTALGWTMLAWGGLTSLRRRQRRA